MQNLATQADQLPAVRICRDTRIAAPLCAIGLILSIICGRLHPDGLIHFDDLTHYLFARWAWTWPTYLLHDWGRPGFTALYFLPAGLGWGACRVLSAILTAASAWLAFRLAQSWRLPSSWAVIPLCYAQPLFFQLSQTTLTETPLAFYLIASVYAVQKNRWTLSATILSLTFVTRHEAVVFLPVYLLLAWRAEANQNPKSKVQNFFALSWAPIATNILQWITGVTPSLALLFEPHPTTQYGRGGWLTYFARSMEAFGPGIMVLALVGLLALLRMRCRLANGPKSGSPAVAFLVLTIVVYFSTQTAVRALGLYASGGYARFLVPLSPLIAICALCGWLALRKSEFGIKILPRAEYFTLIPGVAMLLLWLAMERQIILFNQSGDLLAEMPQVHQAKVAIRIATGMIVAISLLASVRRRSRPVNTLLRGSILALIILAVCALAGPIRPAPETRQIRSLKDQLATQDLANRPVISANVLVDYLFERSLPPDRPTTRRQLELAPEGSLFIWDQAFAPDDYHRLPLKEFIDSAQWRLVHAGTAPGEPSPPAFVIFEKVAAAEPP